MIKQRQRPGRCPAAGRRAGGALARLTADGGGHLLGALDAQAHVAVVVAHHDKGLEAGALAGAGLLLHGHDLHHLLAGAEGEQEGAGSRGGGERASQKETSANSLCGCMWPAQQVSERAAAHAVAPACNSSSRTVGSSLGVQGAASPQHAWACAHQLQPRCPLASSFRAEPRKKSTIWYSFTARENR